MTTQHPDTIPDTGTLKGHRIRRREAQRPHATPELAPIVLPEPSLTETSYDPLFDSRRPWLEQTVALKARRAFDTGGDYV